MLSIDTAVCTGCGQCVAACAFGAMRMDDAAPVVDEACVFCGNCAGECPVGAITMPQGGKKTPGLSGYAGIWAILELEQGRSRLRKVSLELASEARRLADILGQEACAVLLCAEIPAGVETMLGEVGCRRVYIVRRPQLAEYHTERHCGLIAQLAAKHRPAGILFPATENGRDLAPRVSCAMRVGLTADCTGLDIDGDGNLVQIRPTYGGNIMASIISPNHRPQLASVRANVLPVRKVESPVPAELVIEDIEPSAGSSTAALISIREKDSSYKDVAESDIVIVAGYGIGGKENFKRLEKLAVTMNAAIGATRKVVDEGWAPFEIQVGQTGKTVAPSLYIACGVSGALQHTIGMKNAKCKIAVNTDPAAPIFRVADVAVMGDCLEVVERLCEKIKNREGLPARV